MKKLYTSIIIGRAHLAERDLHSIFTSSLLQFRVFVLNIKISV